MRSLLAIAFLLFPAATLAQEDDPYSPLSSIQSPAVSDAVWLEIRDIFVPSPFDGLGHDEVFNDMVPRDQVDEVINHVTVDPNTGTLFKVIVCNVVQVQNPRHRFTGGYYVFVDTEGDPNTSETMAFIELPRYASYGQGDQCVTLFENLEVTEKASIRMGGGSEEYVYGTITWVGSFQRVYESIYRFDPFPEQPE